MLLFALATLTLLAFALPVKGAHIQLFGYSDEPQYKAGERGTLKIWLYNDGADDVVLKNVTVEYPWHGYFIWEGNETIRDINTAIAVKGNWTTTLIFTVPTDGRATGGNVSVQFVTDRYSGSGQIYLDVVKAPAFIENKDVDRLLTLFTLLVVLVIVSTCIIAATIFLSTHRPQEAWSKEKE
jgi:hypothetical protein